MKYKAHKTRRNLNNHTVFAKEYDTGICADENWESQFDAVAQCVIQYRAIRRN